MTEVSSTAARRDSERDGEKQRSTEEEQERTNKVCSEINWVSGPGRQLFNRPVDPLVPAAAPIPLLWSPSSFSGVRVLHQDKGLKGSGVTGGVDLAKTFCDLRLTLEKARQKMTVRL
ncbi:unnamed protein product [Pleuronectes platessa]|uniref:Uncharacterized protein n=1 Tax=Pleuronectes platessa TaxID=8262 RepID=A0A9N7Y9M8_PLEPL|nr:unnamed protein product [Pleuronectes platessa]